MKKSSKLLALLLSFVMMLSLVTVSPTAVSKKEEFFKDYAKYGEYTLGYSSFGDSIAAGYDAADHKDVIGYAEVETAYPCLVSKETGLGDWAFSCIGFRTNELLISLGEEVEKDYYTTSGYSWMYDENGYCNYWDTTIQTSVQWSKLITVEIGSNDVLTGPATMAYLDIPDAITRWTEENNKIEAGLADGSMSQIEYNIRKKANDNIFLVAYYAALSVEMTKGYNTFVENFPKIIEKLRANNNWCDLVIVGMYNPYKDLNVVGDYIDITQIAETLTNQMNKFMKDIAEEYNCIYVDVTDIETFSIGDTISLDQGIKSDAHPTHEGHVEIKDRIIDAIYEAHYAFPFTDVAEDKWYYDYVKEVYDLGYMTGTSATTFRPSDYLTRGQLATILYRMADSPAVEYTDTFSDVAEGKYYTEAVIWAKESGIIKGYQDGTFRPSQNITRQELAIMLRNYAKYCGKDVSCNNDVLDAYPDANTVSSWAKESVAWAVENGLITGDNGQLKPKNTATRGQTAKMILMTQQYINQ